MQLKDNFSISVTPVILCGGSGSRLWPLSRVGFPKQFLVLSGQTSLFQQSIERINTLNSVHISLSETLIVTGEDHRFIALEQLREMSSVFDKLILEPEAKNTAPALTLAALQATNTGNDPVLVVIPADQTVQDKEAFIDAIQKAIEVAYAGSIVILGVKPTGPKTGFGYIKQSGRVGNFGEFNVAEFVEKPDIKTAQFYFDSGEYSWNAGIFIMRASVWIKALSMFRNDILSRTEMAFNQLRVDQQFIRPNHDLFIEIPSVSIDFAVIEKCPGSEFEIKVIPLDAGWSDLGAWDAVWQAGEKDQNGNLIKGDALVESSENNLIYAHHRLISAIGINNLVIIETADAVMVADRSRSQEVRKIVDRLSYHARGECELHRKVSRPWGWYDTLDIGEGFKVKRIQVKPGASLSLQKHEKRAEHWVVVKGTAKVTCGKKIKVLKANESTFIPLGEMHRLTNPTKEYLEIIEVQSGYYLGEDDIIRLNDAYGRVHNCDQS